MAGYTRTVKFTGAASTPVCVELPCSPRGKLDRLIVTQLTGTAGAGPVKVYDRRAACTGQVDLNIAKSGAITSIKSSAGSTVITFTAEHNLRVGDQIRTKDATGGWYNGMIHTVVSVSSATKVITDQLFVSNSTGGVWQTLPFIESVAPASSLVYVGALVSGSLQAFDVNQQYENRDNQSETMRSRYAGLWLEVTPTNNGTFEVAITTESDPVI